MYLTSAPGANALTPLFALTLVWNTGISYGLFPQDGDGWQGGAFAVKRAAVVLLWVWLARITRSGWLLWTLGFIVGGALGNAVDRIAHGGVVDLLCSTSPPLPCSSTGTT